MTAPKLPSLRALTAQLKAWRALTAQLKALHEPYVSLFETPFGFSLSFTHEEGLGEGWRAHGREFIPGSVERECAYCQGQGDDWRSCLLTKCGCRFPCPVCNGNRKVSAPSTFDATAAARRLLAAARDGGSQ